MADGKMLQDVLEVIRSNGLSVSVVRVEGIVLQLSKPWPVAIATAIEKPTPVDEAALAEELRPHPKVTERLERLRKRSLEQFGTVHDDKTLELLAPALLGGA